jgi:ectoine hydroxylase-related dioxygenase (phytanoyl-CoA dioxygenase family)
MLQTDYPLSNDQIQAYARDGHILLRSVASREEIDAVRPLLQDVVRKAAEAKAASGKTGGYAPFFTQVTNVWRQDERLQNVVFARRFAKIAAELMGASGVRLYHDQALFKPPDGKATPWHQDQFYWPLDTRSTITMWMPLLDTPEEMGTMVFASGSHRSGPLTSLPISEDADRAYEQLMRRHRFSLRSYSLDAGDATFHAGWTVHSTHPNRTETTREVLTIIYYPDGTHLLEPDSEFRKVDMQAFHPGQRPGELAASPLNPLLYP